MVELVAAVLFAVLFSFFCSILEAALYAIPISQVEHLAEQGSRSGELLRKFRTHVDAPIAAILTLNTVAHTIGAAIAGAAAAEVFGRPWLSTFSVVFTLIVLVFSEIIPKTIGYVYARQLAPALAWPLQVLIWLLAPLVWFCLIVTRFISGGRQEHPVSTEELEAMARLGQRTGDIDDAKANHVANVLNLENRTIAEVMTPRTVVQDLAADQTMRDLRRETLPTFSRIPVYDRDPEEIVGVVLRRDLLAAMADDRWDTRVKTLMAPAEFVAGSLTLDRVLPRFLESRRHLLVVIDEFGSPAGVVTLEDIIEEILGEEIVDEFDEARDMRALAHRKRAAALLEVGRKGGEEAG